MLKMVDYPRSFLLLSTWYFFERQGGGDHSETFLLSKLFYGTPPSCLKVIKWVGGGGGLQDFSVSPQSPFWFFGFWDLRVWDFWVFVVWGLNLSVCGLGLDNSKIVLEGALKWIWNSLLSLSRRLDIEKSKVPVKSKAQIKKGNLDSGNPPP